MRKRGQVYLIAALILIGILYVILAQPNKYYQDPLERDFNKISKNYYIESNKIINSLINQESSSEQVYENFTRFTTIFTSYAKAQNPEMGLIYIFHYDEDVQVGNYLDEAITVKQRDGDLIIPGCYDKVSASVDFEGLNIPVDIDFGEIKKCVKEVTPSEGKITINYQDFDYELSITKNKPQLMVVTLQDEKEQRQVFIEYN